jgi:hypothetical protein
VHPVECISQIKTCSGVTCVTYTREEVVAKEAIIVVFIRDLHSSPSIIRTMKSRRKRWADHVARMGEKRNTYRLLVGKPEGKRPLGRPKRRWVNNIRMDLAEVVWGYVDWIGLAQDRNRWRALVNSVLNPPVL